MYISCVRVICAQASKHKENIITKVHGMRPFAKTVFRRPLVSKVVCHTFAAVMRANVSHCCLVQSNWLCKVTALTSWRLE